MINRLVACLATAVGMLLFESTDLQAASLYEVLEAGLRNDPVVRVARSRLLAAQAETKMADALLMPRVTYSRQEGRAEFERSQGGRPLGGIGENRSKSFNESLTINAPIYDGEAIASSRQAESRLRLAEAVYRETELSYQEKMIDTYLKTLNAGVELEFAQASVAYLQTAYSSVTQGVKSGQNSDLELLEVEAQLQVAKVQVSEIEKNLINFRHQLEASSGLTIDTLDKLEMKDDFLNKGLKSLTLIKETTYQNNPTLEAARQNIASWEQEVSRQLAGHEPRVNFILQQARGKNDSVNTVDLDSTSRLAQIQVQVPLFSGFGVSASVEKANAELARAQQEYERFRSQITVDLFNSYGALTLSSNKLTAFEMSRKVAQKNVTANLLELANGGKTASDVLETVRREKKASQDYFSVHYEVLMNITKISVLTGELSPQSLVGTQLFSVNGELLLPQGFGQQTEVTHPEEKGSYSCGEFVNQICFEDAEKTLVLPEFESVGHSDF